ncbi:hypothetical protein AWB72_05413 [Caballeronia concitans]|uniref:Antitoxin Xre/MbcA/ParS-like toxin-binding domain-containing protein n=2 Tax=Caballeronia concitans TaxID=1777133 RepID=A0A658R5P5_9BURK|nr:hypothetical protein [Caballeronia concitans]SAL51219.1 hypothetical protein AWB72_05413 [Caballeronia concitans]
MSIAAARAPTIFSETFVGSLSPVSTAGLSEFDPGLELAHWRTKVESGELISRDALRETLQLSSAHFRRLHSQGSIFSVKIDRDKYFPAIFVHQRFRRRLYTVCRIIEPLPEKYRLLFLTSRRKDLGGFTPLACLDDNEKYRRLKRMATAWVVDSCALVRAEVGEQESVAFQALIDASPVALLEPSRAEMEKRVVDAVLNNTKWLTAEMIGRRDDSNASSVLDATRRWKKAGKIFSIERAGQTLYPLYVFDELGNPIPEVAKVLKIFKGYRPFRVASWFESTNALLRGKRPRELLGSDPAAVVEAARDHVVGPVHG